MNTFYTFLLLAAGLSVADPDYRAVWQLRSMLICVMPDSWPALEYADYGCYCGLGGSGTPVDELDRCCQTHDHCYSAAMELKACWPVLENPYTLIYHYSCDKANKTVTCEAKNTECEMFVCECDRKASMCFAGAGYNKEYENWPSERCK
ncbi:phospholipase A2 [Scleropages formosus]|uniref:Phospholipase A2 n=1 Tax=Scleropages formosus TaxID=113540 RepID=A0A8C9R9S0_SCLFO|nr:phospholipase A2 [Scleropages formosus]